MHIQDRRAAEVQQIFWFNKLGDNKLLIEVFHSGSFSSHSATPWQHLRGRLPLPGLWPVSKLHDITRCISVSISISILGIKQYHIARHNDPFIHHNQCRLRQNDKKVWGLFRINVIICLFTLPAVSQEESCLRTLLLESITARQMPGTVRRHWYVLHVKCHLLFLLYDKCLTAFKGVKLCYKNMSFHLNLCKYTLHIGRESSPCHFLSVLEFSILCWQLFSDPCSIDSIWNLHYFYLVEGSWHNPNIDLNACLSITYQANAFSCVWKVCPHSTGQVESLEGFFPKKNHISQERTFSQKVKLKISASRKSGRKGNRFCFPLIGELHTQLNKIEAIALRTFIFSLLKPLQLWCRQPSHVFLNAILKAFKF